MNGRLFLYAKEKKNSNKKDPKSATPSPPDLLCASFINITKKSAKGNAANQPEIPSFLIF